jgi:hypothetical protein
MPFAIGRAADKDPHLNIYTNSICSVVKRKKKTSTIEYRRVTCSLCL